MEQATHDSITSRLAELSVAHAQLRGLAAMPGRCAVLDAPIAALEAAAVADAMLRVLYSAGSLLAEARREREISVAQGGYT